MNEKRFEKVQKNNLFLKKTLDICCENAYIIDMNTAKKDSKMKFGYTSHDQIDLGMQQYIKSVACVDNIIEVTLEQINDYLNKMDWWYGDE
mgnify:CR=1 FL=1